MLRRGFEFLNKHQNVIVFGLLFLGVTGLAILPLDLATEKIEIDERAFLSNYLLKMQHNYTEILSIEKKLGETPDARDALLVEAVAEMGFPVRVQRWKHLEDRQLANIYFQVKSRSDQTEAILVGASRSDADGRPNNNLGIAVVLHLSGLISAQLGWSKDIIVLFSDMGQVGVKAWIDSWNRVSGSLDTGMDGFNRGQVMHCGIFLDFGHLRDLSTTNSLAINYMGNNGALPNMDLIGFLITVSAKSVVNSFQSGPDSYLARSREMWKAIIQQSTGSNNPHGPLLRHRIDSLTLSGTWVDGRESITEDLVGAVELLLKGINNLVEHLHHSTWFYIVVGNRFIPQSRFLIPGILLIAGILVKGLFIWKMRRGGSSVLFPLGVIIILHILVLGAVALASISPHPLVILSVCPIPFLMAVAVLPRLIRKLALQKKDVLTLRAVSCMWTANLLLAAMMHNFGFGLVSILAASATFLLSTSQNWILGVVSGALDPFGVILMVGLFRGLDGLTKIAREMVYRNDLLLNIALVYWPVTLLFQTIRSIETRVGHGN